MIKVEIDGVEAIVTRKNIKILDSWKVNDKRFMKRFIITTLYRAPVYNTSRSINAMVREWKSHNIMYKLGMFVTHTKDCDLEANEAYYRRIVYFILGRF